MKHVYLALLACATLCVQTLSADPIGSTEALRIAQQQYSMENTSVLRAGSFPEFKLAYVGTEEGIEAPSKLRSSSVENALLYLYNVGDNQGFVIVSGEDRGKQLLGISDKGALPEKGLSATMENFMRMYIHYVKALRSGMPLAVDSVEASSRFPEAVIPLIKTEWKDDAPYNEMCPVVNDVLTFAGGEGVAMAQIMNYYQYPKSGMGNVNYKNPGSTLVVSANFGHTTYDWENMPATLDESSSWDEIEAVSTLIFHCGAVAYMNYEWDMGANKEDVRKAFINNFGYDKNIQLYDRTFFSGKEWTDLLKTELAAQRPVYYEGGSGENNQAYKWAFVCDGYNRSGLFHLNTGWFGSGYFELGAIGDNLRTYNERQAMITGIRKPSDDSKPVKLLTISSLGTKDIESIKLGEKFPITYNLFNLGQDGSYVHTLAFFEENEAVELPVSEAAFLDTIADFQLGNYITKDFLCESLGIPDTTATLYMYVLGGMEGDSILRPIRSVNHPYDYILLDVKDSVISFSQARNSLTADPVKVEYDAESGTATFEVTFYNKQKTNFQGTAGLYVRDPNLSIDDYSWEVNNWLEIPAGKSQTVSYSGSFDWGIGDMLAVMATYQGYLSELWETKYTDIRESYRTFCLKIDGSLVVSNEVTEPSVSDLEYAFDSASGLLSVQSDVAIENMMLYTYDGASVWGTTIDSRKQYTTTLPILPGHYILRIKTADGIISKKIYKQ